MSPFALALAMHDFRYIERNTALYQTLCLGPQVLVSSQVFMQTEEIDQKKAYILSIDFTDIHIDFHLIRSTICL